MTSGRLIFNNVGNPVKYRTLRGNFDYLISYVLRAALSHNEHYLGIRAGAKVINKVIQVMMNYVCMDVCTVLYIDSILLPRPASSAFIHSLTLDRGDNATPQNLAPHQKRVQNRKLNPSEDRKIYRDVEIWLTPMENRYGRVVRLSSNGATHYEGGGPIACPRGGTEVLSLYWIPVFFFIFCK